MCVYVCVYVCVCVLHFTTGLGKFIHIIYAHYNSTVTVIIYNYNIICMQFIACKLPDDIKPLQGH